MNICAFVRQTLLTSLTFFTSGYAMGDIDIDALAAEKLNWVEDLSAREQVVAYAKSGSPRIALNSGDCPSHFPDAIGTEPFQFCGQVSELPLEVSGDLLLMQNARFDNISDYDQRVTTFVAIRHSGDIYQTINTLGSEALKHFINVEPAHVKQSFLSVPTPDSAAYLFSLQALYVGYDLNVKTSLINYVFEIAKNTTFIHAGFGPTSVMLYPGGGYTVRFNFYISEHWLIYAKSEGWDS